MGDDILKTQNGATALFAIDSESCQNPLSAMNGLTQGKVARDTDAAWKMQDTQEGKPYGWLQWQGTDVCMDLICACGKSSHFDGSSMYHIKCPFCGRVYFCNGHIELIELKNAPREYALAEKTPS